MVDAAIMQHANQETLCPELSMLCIVKEGELPSEMVPTHNDDPYSDDEEEQEEEKAPKISKLLKPEQAGAIRMPLKLTSSLTGKLPSSWVGHTIYIMRNSFPLP